MNDIYRFNNKYLKCIITKYPSTVNDIGYLANSGALIVYHPENESELYIVKNIDGTESEYSYNRNYIYLGNEFLASGYGFLCKDMRIKAERIVEEYDDTIKALKKADEDEQYERKLEDKNLWDNFDKYVAIDGGNITRTNVTIDGSIINTKDILLYGEEAKYQNLEITKITVQINGVNVEDNDVYLPLGTRIKYIDVDIEYNINDSGGIEKIEVIHKNLNYEGQTIQNTTINRPYIGSNGNWFIGDVDILIPYNNEIPYINEEGYWYIDNINTEIKAINIESVILNYDLDNSSKSDDGVVHYKKIFDDNAELYVTGTINDIISGFYIYVRKTPIVKYKNYPMIEDNLGIKIKSIGNIIKDNKIEVLKNINIIPNYNLYYSFKHNYNETPTINEIRINHINIDLNIKGSTSLIVNVNTDDNFKVLYFGLPIQYKIDNVYGVNNNYEKYNWTGAILMDSQKHDLLIYTNNNGINYTSQYNLYKIADYDNQNNDKGFICKQIIIDVSLKDNNISYNVKYNDNIEENASLIFSQLSTNINNENFNSLYWINFKNNNDENIINNKLNNAISNCT